MRIVIDARMYGLEHAGIGRYVMNLVDQIEKIDTENEYFILLRKKYFNELFFKNQKFHKILSDFRHYSFIEQVYLPIQLIKLKPDLVHFPNFNVPLLWWGKQVVTIHDLIKHESRGKETTTRQPVVYWLKFFIYRLMVWLSVKKAIKIIVPSLFWKMELIRRYHLESEKIIVTYEGVDDKFQEPAILAKGQWAPGSSNQQSAEVLGRYRVVKPYIIYTGSLYPHKNVERLVEAIKRYHVLIHDNKKLSLVVVCARSVFYERFKKRIRELKAEKFVNLVGFVSDKELLSLYYQAEAFVLPTLIEGFGLTGLEAMAAGCPVLASRIPVLEEIYGSAALYFNPLNPKDIAEKIKMVVGKKSAKEKLIKLGLAQAKKYSWKKMASKTLKVYREVVGKGN